MYSYIRVSGIFTVFSGISGAGIMSALATFGVGGGLYTVANQKSLEKDLENLIRKSYELKKSFRLMVDKMQERH